MSYKSITISLIMSFFVIGHIHSQITETVKVHRMHYVSPSATLELNNKYGNIHISTWDVDSVCIDIDFFISEKNESRFSKVKENVDFKITGNSAYLMAETVFGSKYSSFFSDIKEATNLMSTNQSTQINYFVKVPNYINLKINNRYGNVFIPDFQGNLNVELSNGDFQAKKITGSNNLNLAFGLVLIDELEQANIQMNFCEAKINKAAQLDLSTKTSKVNITECNLIKLQSKRDEYSIDQIGFLFGDAYFSKLNILNVDNEFNMLLQYGELTNLGINTDFKLVRINSQYANCNLLLSSPSAYTSSIMASKSEIELASMLKSNTDNWKEKINTEPVLFYFIDKSAKEKMQINISGATLKINHK